MSRRKVEMILELVDRYTKTGRRFIAMQDRMGRAAERANRLAARGSRMAERASRLYQRAVQATAHAQDALQRGIRQSNVLIRRQISQMRTATGLMRDGVMGVGRAALLAGTMFTAYAGTVSLAASSFLGPARQFENFGVQLESIEGSSAKAQDAMRWIENFATSTPLELHQVVEAYQQMRTFGMDPTNGSMMALVDSMAASGKGAEQLNGLVLALGKSWTKGKLQGEEIMMLMERGVPVWDMLAEKTGKNVEQLQKMSSAGKLGREEIQLLIDAMAEKNAGASEKMSRTWDGIISNLMDWWTRFQRTVMGFGVFDWMKDRLRGVLDMLNEMEASGELEVWAKAIADNMLIGLNALWDFGAGAIDLWQQVYPWIETAAHALGGWRNLALALLAIPLRGVIFATGGAFLQLAGGAALATKAMAGIGFHAAWGGALRLGSAMLALLNPVKWVRAAMIALRVAMISTGIGAIAVGLAMAGVWIYNNWSGLVSFFQGFGAAFMEALGPARPIVEGIAGAVSSLFEWFGKLLGPISASGDEWRSWGEAAGAAVGSVIAFVMEFPGSIISGLQSGWSAVASWVSGMWPDLAGAAQTAWNALKLVLLNFTPAKLIFTHWDTLSGWVSGMWPDLAGVAQTAWNALKAVLLTFTPAKLIYTHWEGIAAWFTDLWNSLPSIDWSELINLEGIQQAWDAVANWFSEATAGLWDLMPEMPEWDFKLWGDDTIEDPKTLLAAAEAAERLERQFPAVDQAAQSTLANVQSAVTTISTLLAGTDYTSEGARLMQTLADGIRSKVAEVTAAVQAITQAIRNTLPKSATMNVGVQGAGAPVQARASGGAFSPGWLLTGERGPELEYRTRGGYIAHNQALGRMVSMSRQAARNAAVAGGVAAGGLALPAAADLPDAGPSAAIGARYLTQKSVGATSVNAPISLTINGNVDQATVPDIKSALEDLRQQLMDEMEDARRAAERVKH